MVKITNYTKSEIVEIQFGDDPTSYQYALYEKGMSQKLVYQLLKIIDAKAYGCVEITNKEFKE
jgi:hypothetical protein|tara:strand:- start:2 stop:190 length:189 start_codon:yes stop_codon:yes gene_type:complete